MRHETCAACRVPGATPTGLREMLLITESVAGPGFMHHHHVVDCGGCKQWWFDDVVIGGLGMPVASRRDTEFCPCDEALDQYTPGIIHVPAPESECKCTKAQVDKSRLRIPLSYKAAGTPRHHEPVPRGEAVRDISDHIQDHTAFILSAPPDTLAGATAQLKSLAGTTCYLDIGFPGVTRLRSPHLPEAAAIARSQPPGTTTAVFIVPKTIPAAQLSRLLGREIPADGSQDLVMLHTQDDTLDLPALLVDAIAVHDPGLAEQLRANDLRNMS